MKTSDKTSKVRTDYKPNLEESSRTGKTERDGATSATRRHSATSAVTRHGVFSASLPTAAVASNSSHLSSSISQQSITGHQQWTA